MYFIHKKNMYYFNYTTVWGQEYFILMYHGLQKY